MERHELRIKPQPKNEKINREKEIDAMKTQIMYGMTINNILNPLLEIVYEYKASSAYNCVPESNKDSKSGWKYYGNKFNYIFKALNANIFLNEKQYKRIYSIIEGLFSFVRKFEYANGLPDMFLEANENLNYYLLAFTIPKDQREMFREKVIGMPGEAELSAADNYHANLQRKSENLNLQFDEEDFFMDELACAIRRLFKIALNL